MFPELLRALMKMKMTWVWGHIEVQVFEDIKKALLDGATMTYFDPAKATGLVMGVSLLGLDAMLTQEREPGQQLPIVFAIQVLTATEA
ncbi:hypothetical protein NDU88_004380 [Pleurodeles waltl]|uniref:Reverse transcriptase/retrotransposon-derived protein RNase H-like domain-containing protein n=1 Tax=Pleurodeles waltl TaxID=8319 RepID=A0AAV7M7Q4_PLEWA|nr:hypothetical protein NDU88_004380 [Pleurodeles waltl]